MLSALSVNGTNVISLVENSQYTISNITSNTSVVAVFDPIPVVSYTLSIQSSAGGSIVYNGTNVSNDTQQFSVNEGATVVRGITPDNGYVLKKFLVNNTDVTDLVSDGNIKQYYRFCHI